MKLKFALAIFNLFIISISLIGCFEKSPSKPYQIQKNISSDSITVKTISQIQDVSAALKLIDARLEVVRGVFSPEVDPYIGKKNLAEKCHPENLPKIIEIQDTKQIAKALSLYSSDNRIFGNCSTERLLKTQYLVLFCKKTGELFGFTYYYEDHLPWTKQPIAYCD
jgi:hypothetical protein